MKEISHEQAQAFLQAAADELLRAEEKTLLDAHLLGCDVCRAYARKLTRLESALRTTMQRRWGVSSRPIHLDQILSWQKEAPLRRVPSIVATPILVVFLVMFAVVLTRGSTFRGTKTATPSVSIITTSIPTPSVELVSTNMISAGAPSSTTLSATTTTACEYVHYTIQPGDTLASIAEKFGVSVEAIREANWPPVDFVSELIIPICNPTPNTTLTYTPSFTPTSYTP